MSHEIDGFGAGAGQFKSYDYRPGEILVLELADSVKKGLDTKIRESDKRMLVGNIKMSDFGSAITSSSASYQKALKREQKRQAIRARNQIRREAQARAQIYIPKTPDTAASYEEITAIISDLVGGVPDDVLHQTAYDVLRLLKSEGITDEQRTQGVDKLLCVKVSPEIVARLFTLSASLTDFTINNTVNLEEADEDGIVALGNVPDDDEKFSSSSDDDESSDDDDEIRVSMQPLIGTNWNVDRLRDIVKAEFEENYESKLDDIVKLLETESGSKLETEIARIFHFKNLNIVSDIIKNKDSIIGRNVEQNSELKKLNFGNFIFEEGSHYISLLNPKLPPNAEVKDTESYREITVPFEVSRVDVQRIPIADLPKYAQPAFSSFQTLNATQSFVYPTILTDENLLVAAPTGAGKTNIALLCMLKEFQNHEGCKVVYVAPMKSLVQEMVGSFSYRLQSYGKVVVELTGDSSASKFQLEHADVIVTTPEKWDIITRKIGSQVLTEKVRLMIIDEIHLLHDERGPVLEALIARMKRIVDSTRQPIRFVGLSATMPNYVDVAFFLGAEKGLSVCDERFRPCPLRKVFIGVRNKLGLAAKREMNDICFDKIVERVETAQILVFTHSRRDTVDTARYFIEKAADGGISNLFASPHSRTADILMDSAERAHNKDLKDVIPNGFAFHNAGLDADDRKLVESLFSQGYIKVLISTATLAWGVNLPAHTVIIKGTRVYNPEHSSWENLSHLDVLQMFGRAGRPQFDTFGEGIIITELRELQYYISVLNQQLPIESHFLRDVASHLNAEISLGTITSLEDAAEWIGYTYLFIRMLRAPGLYKVDMPANPQTDDEKTLKHHRLEIVHTAALELDEKRLIRYNQKTGSLEPTNLGVIASNYYISAETMSKFSQFLRPYMTDSDIFRLFCASSEFKNISVRPEEKAEVSKLINHVPIPIKEPADDPAAKINVLLQCYICRASLRGFSLMADMIYISQNAERIMRCMFEIALSLGYAETALQLLSYAKMVGVRMWYVQSPLRQFREVPTKVVAQLERKYFPWGRYFDLTPQRLGEMAKSPKDGELLAETIKKFPRLKVSARKLPLTRDIIKFNIEVEADFEYDPAVHHATEPFWVFVCDSDVTKVLYSDLFLLKSMHPQVSLSFVVPLLDPLPPYYFIKIVSDRWIPCETELTVNLMDVIRPDLGHISFKRPTGDNAYSPVYETAIHHLDKSILFSAPPNSGRYSCCDDIIASLIQQHQKIAIIIPVYDKFIRMAKHFEKCNFNFVSLTGDPDGDRRKIEKYDLIIATHNMFIGLNEFNKFNTIFLYDLHLINDENFSEYEVLISLMLYLKSEIEQETSAKCPIRFIAVTLPISNPKSISRWLQIDDQFSFIYSPKIRNINIHIKTFNFLTAKSRLMSMARSLFTAIRGSSTSIVFVPTKSQMYITAKELINFANITRKPNTFIRFGQTPPEFPFTNQKILEAALNGIALFHPSLSREEKDYILNNFGTVFGCIIVLIDTVWEFNMMAEVVVMKGTDIYDGTSHQHVEYPIEIVMETIGFTLDGGSFFLFTRSSEKTYYFTFLKEPICVESNFDLVSQDAFNTAISFGVAGSKYKLVKLITNTLFYRRLISNPTYYGLVSNEKQFVSDFISELVDNTTKELSDVGAIQLGEDEISLDILTIGQISADHQIDARTVDLITRTLTPSSGYKQLLRIVCASSELSFLPLKSPKRVAKLLSRFDDAAGKSDEPSALAYALLRNHMARFPIPADFLPILYRVCTAFLRISAAIVDISTLRGWLKPAIGAIQLQQRVVQSLAIGASDLLQLPHIDEQLANDCRAQGITTIDQLRDVGGEDGGEELLKRLLRLDTNTNSPQLNVGNERKWQDICDAVNRFPGVAVSAKRAPPSTISVLVERDIDEDEVVEEYVLAPRFPMKKTENWYVVLANDKDQVISIEKIIFQRSEEVNFTVSLEEMQSNLRVYILCDSYSGCDRACDVE